MNEWTFYMPKIGVTHQLIPTSWHNDVKVEIRASSSFLRSRKSFTPQPVAGQTVHRHKLQYSEGNPPQSSSVPRGPPPFFTHPFQLARTKIQQDLECVNEHSEGLSPFIPVETTSFRPLLRPRSRRSTARRCKGTIRSYAASVCLEKLSQTGHTSLRPLEWSSTFLSSDTETLSHNLSRPALNIHSQE